MNRLLARFPIILVFALSISACDTALIRHYEGPQKTNKEISKLFHKSEKGWRVSHIDNKSLVNGFTTWSGSAGVDEIHLLPGQHAVLGQLLLGNRYALFNLKHNFEAGKDYQLGYKLLEEVVENRVVIFIEKAKDEPIDNNTGDDSGYSTYYDY